LLSFFFLVDDKQVNSVLNSGLSANNSSSSSNLFDNSNDLEKSLVQLLNGNGQFVQLLQKKFGSLGGDNKLLERVNKLEKQIESLVKSESTAYQLLMDKFKSLKQNININEFSQQDESGFVYGWNTKVNLYLLKFGGHNCVVDGKGFVSLHDISIYSKKFVFYTKATQTEAKNVIIANSVEDGVEDKCNELGISIWFVESQPNSIIKL